MRRKLTFFVFSLLVSSVSFAGPVISYQAKAIEAIMNEPEFMNRFRNLKTGAFVKRLEHISWSNGVTHYRVVTDKDCSFLVKTTAKDEFGFAYDVEVGTLSCP